MRMAVVYIPVDAFVVGAFTCVHPQLCIPVSVVGAFNYMSNTGV